MVVRTPVLPAERLILRPPTMDDVPDSVTLDYKGVYYEHECLFYKILNPNKV